MASIPLVCSICPGHANFSDLSHLLTHVASKGHLSNHFNAQMRSLQDESVRLQLNTYNQWFETYNIGPLVSQRMAMKASKNTKDTRGTDSKKAPTKKATKARRKPTKPATPEPSKVSVKTEDKTIDPLLPQYPNRFELEADHGHGYPASHSGLAFGNPDQGPYLPTWQKTEMDPPLPGIFKSVYSKTEDSIDKQHMDSDHEGDEDYFRTFLRSPTQSIYPDPSQIESSASLPSSGQDDTTGQIKLVFKPKNDLQEKDEAEIPRSPVLKGMKWPGMSLFDSANTNAQRLRNQKKDGSVLERMELNAAAVEPSEVIYWPGGTHKQTREITGNVESSPMSEVSSPPKQQRARPPKLRIPLSNIDPNKLRSRRRVIGTPRPMPAEEQDDLIGQDVSTKQPKAKSRQRRILQSTRGDTEHHSILDQHAPESSKQATFSVFRDKLPDAGTSQRAEQPNPVLAAHASIPEASRPSPASLDDGYGFPFDPEPKRQHRVRDQFSRGYRATTPANVLYELSPVRGTAQSTNEEKQELEVERVSQRYFIVTDNGQPQFYNSMPPQMDFGGLAGPWHFGTTLNPLNPMFQPPRFRTPFQPPMRDQFGSSRDRSDENGSRQPKPSDLDHESP